MDCHLFQKQFRPILSLKMTVQIWMSSLETVGLLYGEYQTAKGVIRQTSVPKLRDGLNSTFTGKLIGDDVTLDNVQIREISYIKR